MKNQQIIIGIMGPGEYASKEDCTLAFEVGKILASEKYIVLTGGRNCGVMDEALKGAKEAGGITIGILPGNDTTEISQYVDIPIITGMGNARNNINILSSKVVVTIGEGPGTISEMALCLKNKKPLIAINSSKEAVIIFNRHAKKLFFPMDRFNKKDFLALLKTFILET